MKIRYVLAYQLAGATPYWGLALALLILYGDYIIAMIKCLRHFNKAKGTGTYSVRVATV